jgi:hypothetical protein
MQNWLGLLSPSYQTNLAPVIRPGLFCWIARNQGRPWALFVRYDPYHTQASREVNSGWQAPRRDNSLVLGYALLADCKPKLAW